MQAMNAMKQKAHGLQNYKIVACCFFHSFFTVTNCTRDVDLKRGDITDFTQEHNMLNQGGTQVTQALVL